MSKYAQDLLNQLPGYLDVEIQRTNRTGQAHGRNIHGVKSIRVGNYEIWIRDPLNTEYYDLFGYAEEIVRTDGDTIEQAILNALDQLDRVVEQEGATYYTPEEVRLMMQDKFGPLSLTDLGREIRACVPEWVHPIGKYGWPIPIDGPRYREAMDNWILEAKGIDGGLPESLLAEKPRADQYMPRWDKRKVTAFQVYETQYRGTPLSPVLLDRAAVREWFIEQGYAKREVIEFSKTWAKEPDHKGVVWPTRENLDSM